MPLSVSGEQLCACAVVCAGCGACGACVTGAAACVVGAGACVVGAGAAAVVGGGGGALVAGVRDLVTTGEGTAGWLDADTCDDEAVPPTAVGLSPVVVVGGGLTLTARTMIATMPTTPEMTPRRRTDQSARNQSRTNPTGKQKISKSTT